MPDDSLHQWELNARQAVDAIDRLRKCETAVSTATDKTSGSVDAGRLVKLGAHGQLDPSLLPSQPPSRQHDGHDLYDVRNFGAVWDGASHPLSERFATLGAAQAVYPHARSLTDEIDWAATQAAINQIVIDWAGRGQRYGGEVILPGGHARLNRALFYPSNSVWIWLNEPVVNIRGQGRGSTILEWRDNAAAIDGGYVLQPRVAAVDGGQVIWSGDHAELHADCRLSGFALRGPGNWRGWDRPRDAADFAARYGYHSAEWRTAYNSADLKVGQLYETYGGISAGERTCVDDVFLSGFHVGLNWRGGQKSARMVFTENCYYGVYLTFTEAAHGDFVMTKCSFAGRFAAIAIAPNAGWFGHMDTCFFGRSPYAFYKEGTAEALSDAAAAAAHGGHWNDFVSGTFTYCQFEDIGNAIFAEGNVTRRHELRDLTLVNPFYVEVPGSDFSIPASATGPNGTIPRAALIDAKRWTRVKIVNPMNPEWWKPRDHAIFRFSEAAEGVVIEGCDGFISACGGRTQMFRAGEAGSTHFNLWPGGVELHGLRWQGTLVRIGTNNGPDIVPGDLVGYHDFFVGKVSTSAGAFLGVAVEPNRNTGIDQMLAVATRSKGAMRVNRVAGATANNNVPIGLSSTPGKATVKTSMTTAFGRMLGTDGSEGCYVIFPLRL